MIVVEQDGVTIFAHEHENYTVKHRIELNEESYLMVGYNPTSTLYDEELFKKSPISPYVNNLWYIGHIPRTYNEDA